MRTIFTSDEIFTWRMLLRSTLSLTPKPAEAGFALCAFKPASQKSRAFDGWSMRPHR
jgi:hypothetical protein